MKRRKNLTLILFVLILILSACKDSEVKDEIITDKEECIKVEKEVGIDIAFVLDSSGSMQKNDSGNLRIDKVKVIVKEMTDEDRALVISFDKEAKLLTEHITDDKDVIISALNKIPSDQKYTNLAAGINLAIDEFSKNDNQNQKIIIALTDGENAGETDEITEKTDQYTYTHSLAASNQNIIIYTIGLGNDIDEDLLENVADITGGKYFHTEDNFGLEEVYRNVVEELKCLPVEKAKEDDKKYILFEDNNLKQFINELLGFKAEYNLTKEDLSGLTELSFNSLAENSISSLEGLQYAVNLKTIILNNQNIADLSPLVNLTNLEKIEINNNDLGLINILTDEEKQLYANYLVEKQNEETTLKLVNGKILDANKDGKLDLVLIYSGQCEIPDYECIYIEIITNDVGKAKVLYDTKQYSNDAQNHVFDVGGDISHNSIYINNTKSTFELVINTSGGSRANHAEYYQYIKLDKNKNFSYSATKLYASYCPPGDDECEDINSIEEIQGNIDLEYVLDIIEKRKMVITIDDENSFFNQLYQFATVQLITKESLMPQEGMILSYEPSFTEERGTFVVYKDNQYTLLMPQEEMMYTYGYFEDENHISMGVDATDWIFFDFDYSMIGAPKEEDNVGFNMFPPEFGYLKEISSSKSITVKAGTLKNVTIFHTDTGYRLYFAPGYGLVKIENDTGKTVTELIEVK